MRLPDAALAGLVFHELAHQQVYAKGDTVFNESFASLVEQEGTARWLASRGDTPGLCRLQLSIGREAEVHHLLGEARAQLDDIYRSSRSVREKRAAKVAALEDLRARYRDLRAGWPGPPRFDAWFAGTLDNASLGAIAAYDQLVGKLRVILEAEGGDLPAFYGRAARLARLDPAGRAEVLREIRTPAAPRSPPDCPAG
jgi:predicted aminopeptidase